MVQGAEGDWLVVPMQNRTDKQPAAKAPIVLSQEQLANVR